MLKFAKKVKMENPWFFKKKSMFLHQRVGNGDCGAILAAFHTNFLRLIRRKRSCGRIPARNRKQGVKSWILKFVKNVTPCFIFPPGISPQDLSFRIKHKKLVWKAAGIAPQTPSHPRWCKNTDFFLENHGFRDFDFFGILNWHFWRISEFKNSPPVPYFLQDSAHGTSGSELSIKS